MPTKIKICGITKLFEVEFINEMDIDFVGFVFAESKRKVDVEQARKLSLALRSDIKRCGVFVDRSVEEINRIARKVKLDIAQLHKNYTSDMAAQIDIPTWYAVNIKDKSSIDRANKASLYENVAGIVADSYVKGQEGGTGETFNWDLLSGLDEKARLILAGGLNAQNIKIAIDKTKPYAVDVSSGVEEIIGGILQKKKSKVHEFVRTVREYEQN